uniref:protein-tyrosine-phosphatase n=1 Tax=Apophua simplicipes ichnovirus TaxID=1329648 RepID=S5DR79_9VIRU|nr:AsIV-cont00069-ORF1 [Apophua simplicipes ichnovirus]
MNTLMNEDATPKQEGESSAKSFFRIFKKADVFGKPENQSKNRRADVPCWDHSRVTLSNLFGRSSTSDYIHANWLDGHGKCRKYIATQAPMKNTIDDFLDMIMQYTCRYVVVLTDIMEEGVEKCYLYWPTKDHEIRIFDRWSISLRSKYDRNGYSKYLLELRSCQESENVLTFILYHYTNWTEKNGPKNREERDKFVAETRSEINDYRHLHKPYETPIVVHGSLGMRRTVHYCVRHELLDFADEEKSEVPKRIFHQIAKTMYSARYCPRKSIE